MIRIILLIFTLTACQDPGVDYTQDAVVIDTHLQGSQSTTAGNLMATAIKRKHDLDVVLYPSVLIRPGVRIYKDQLDSQEIEDIVSLYPDGERDQFVIGTMSGRDIKTLIYQRSLERFNLELEVAGLRYDIMFKGGFPLSQTYQREKGLPLLDNDFYSIAISQHFIFSGVTFPSYKYRNSIDRIFIDSNVKISARAALRSLLEENRALPFLKEQRARVRSARKKTRGFKTISQIQGQAHLSPFMGDIVSTQGIVIAAANADTYPGGSFYYIQTQKADQDPRTSEAIKLYYHEEQDIKVGDLIQVTGTVFEESNHIENGLTTTALWEITQTKVLAINQKLPPATKLTKIPEGHFSTFNGNIHLKPSLKLTDGLDFWESMEGMRISITNPKIVGFRGGKEQSDDRKTHLTLYLLPNGKQRRSLNARGGGLMADPDRDLFNPQILPLASGPMTKGLNLNANYKIGDTIEGELTGHLSFAKNLFGDGEFILTLPQEQQSLKDYTDSISNRVLTDIADRPSTSFDPDKLSIAAYNVKNLSPANKARIRTTGKMIKTNLNCPDVLGLVEIQDNNGEDFEGNSAADNTLELLIKNTPCNFTYQEANIDPLLHREGGIPGANIRVALLFNPKRLGFIENKLPGPEVETVIQANGSLNFNPGRIYPQDRAFRNTRKSIVAQFEYQGKKLFVVVNHFNSKLSDTSHFSSIWPMVYPSEVKRTGMARAVNRFVSRVEKRAPDSLIAVIGDFNEFINMPAMRILEGTTLFNLMRTIPENQRYTTNHNGNSQPLDYIFVNRNLQQKTDFFKVLHLNSDYMGRLSDHDPVIGVFDL